MAQLQEAFGSRFNLCVVMLTLLHCMPYLNKVVITYTLSFGQTCMT